MTDAELALVLLRRAIAESTANASYLINKIVDSDEERAFVVRLVHETHPRASNGETS